MTPAYPRTLTPGDRVELINAYGSRIAVTVSTIKVDDNGHVDAITSTVGGTFAADRYAFSRVTSPALRTVPTIPGTYELRAPVLWGADVMATLTLDADGIWTAVPCKLEGGMRLRRELSHQEYIYIPRGDGVDLDRRLSAGVRFEGVLDEADLTQVAEYLTGGLVLREEVAR